MKGPIVSTAEHVANLNGRQFKTVTKYRLGQVRAYAFEFFIDGESTTQREFYDALQTAQRIELLGVFGE